MKFLKTASLFAAVGTLLALTLHGRLASAQQQSLEQQYWVEDYAGGLNRPRALAWLPDGRILLALWDGSIKLLKNGKVVDEVTGGPEVFKDWFMGLRDLALDPDFASNHFVYLSYVGGDVTVETYRTSGRVWRARLEGNKLVDGKVIFNSVTPNGLVIMGPIFFMPDKTLLVPVGSQSQGEIFLVQRRDNHMGKVIRINRDGSIPKDNPFLNDPKTLPEIYALGLRNASGIAQTQDGKLWVVDIGPKGGDELNLLQPGGNYGWPIVTWGFDYSGESMIKFTGSTWQQQKPGMIDPVLVWTPVQVPSALMLYRGKLFPFWDGDLFTGGLASLTLRRVRIRNDKVVLQEAMLSELKDRLRTVQEGPDGLIYVMTDSYNTGRILRIHPGKPPAGTRVAAALAIEDEKDPFGRQATPNALRELGGTRPPVDPRRWETAFEQTCSGCHSFGKFKTGKIGPDLNGVDGRKSGTLPGFNYTAAMKDPDRQVIWNYLSLWSYLVDPQHYFPGTAMVLPPTTFRQRLDSIDYITGGAFSKVYGPKPTDKDE